MLQTQLEAAAGALQERERALGALSAQAAQSAAAAQQAQRVQGQVGLGEWGGGEGCVFLSSCPPLARLGSGQAAGGPVLASCF